MVEGGVVMTVKAQHEEDFYDEGQFCILATVMVPQI